jgi:hypothetical protein
MPQNYSRVTHMKPSPAACESASRLYRKKRVVNRAYDFTKCDTLGSHWIESGVLYDSAQLPFEGFTFVNTIIYRPVVKYSSSDV